MTSASGAPDAHDLATKGEPVEEWLDLRFFRPVGARIARAAYPTRVSPDFLTLVCLLVGLLAGHLFVYTSPWLNGLGFILFIVSDFFDSADGQLARLRGNSTPFGRILDGISDNARFVNLYAHLAVRLVHGGWSAPAALALVIAAGLSHSTQSAAVDFIRHAFLAIGVGRGSELDDGRAAAGAQPRSVFRRLALGAYGAYVARQRRMFPRTWALAMLAGRNRVAAVTRGAYRQLAEPLLPRCAWLGQNIRFLLIGIAGIAGHPSAMLWATLVPMNLIMLALIARQEQVTGRVLAAGSDVVLPPAEPVGVA
jgi:hypothetical protein